MASVQIPPRPFGFLCHNHIGHSGRRANWRPRELQGVPDVPWLYCVFRAKRCILNGACCVWWRLVAILHRALTTAMQ